MMNSWKDKVKQKEHSDKHSAAVKGTHKKQCFIDVGAQKGGAISLKCSNLRSDHEQLSSLGLYFADQDFRRTGHGEVDIEKVTADKHSDPTSFSLILLFQQIEAEEAACVSSYEQASY
jgi:hypothetical protein